MNFPPALRSVAVVAAAALALATAGCGGSGGGGDDELAERATVALTGLYVIDHDGVEPTEQTLEPYQTAFAKVRDRCAGSPEDLASSIQNASFRASNGSGTHVTNLEALRAVGRFLDTNPQQADDCRGVFVGVEAFLQGNALD